MTPELRDSIKVDKSKWPRGAWDSEPDRVDFRHAGFPCLLSRGPGGQWCGYVGLSPTHALYGKSYDDADVEVHGGLTYGAHCKGHICHVPEPGEVDEVYWLGFDCAHGGDYCPAFARYLGHFGEYETYRTVEYARRQTERLADQLARLA